MSKNQFQVDQCLKDLAHYLPAQAPLKDFIHHNTLHAFQTEKFEVAIRNAAKIFGYKVSLSLGEYRDLYVQKKIRLDVTKKVIEKRHGENVYKDWLDKLLYGSYDSPNTIRVGNLRKVWKDKYHIDLNTIVNTNLFRILNSYLDQGIAIIKFPIIDETFLGSMRRLEHNSWVSFFKTERARKLLFDPEVKLVHLLEILVGDEQLYYQYLFDQQFGHPGWSGLVANIERNPQSLLDTRKISLKEVIFLELLLEIDNLDNTLGNRWKPVSQSGTFEPFDIFEYVPLTELDEVLNTWQEAYEWTYYDKVLSGIKYQKVIKSKKTTPSFQAFFCIDDRECSIRRYVEQADPNCATFGTPGHFAIDTYYQPKDARFYTKVCPAPLSPKHLIMEVSINRKNGSDLYFTKTTQSLFRGWLITNTLGFWSAIKMMFNIFKPSLSPASSSSFNHMDEFSNLTVENRSIEHIKDGLQIGYTIEEMVDRVEAVLMSTGLVSNFAPVVYMIGHGASSANNTHYAGYDCGACSGRPGSANARAISFMANHRIVREKLANKGIVIPISTEFVGGLHDTTRDAIVFYDEELLTPHNLKQHRENVTAFKEALMNNARERSRRFMSINSRKKLHKVYEEVQQRSVSLFEPRPELNHATNSLCIVGRKELNNRLFLDRRAFLNSYDYKVDPDGKYLLNIINAAAPVCGGINLEYFFSRVDNERLGAGSKLPHNVMGLIGVANGFEGDLRPGLPIQMVEVHDPIRLMLIIEQIPDVVLDTIQRNASTYEWFINEWVILAVIHPETREVYHFKDGHLHLYEPMLKDISELLPEEIQILIESNSENLPVFQMV
ncbi:MAG: hypothetical protein ACI8TA_001455 [Cyclobacteriaceae bacterium]|jgi:uncharacterized protein YbcC (UPF0753/DUF2309 family)